MATQIIEVDLRAPRHTVPVRTGVEHVLLVFLADAGPIGARQIPRPADGVLRLHRVLGMAPALVAAEPALLVATNVPLSAVVCTRERPDDLKRCLAALTRCLREGDEAIVIDNNPRTDATATVAASFGIRYLVEPRSGLNRARNAGIRAAAHDLIAFVDDDVVVTPFWREGLARGFNDPGLGCVTGLVLPMELETAAQEEFEVYAAHRRTFRTRVFSSANLRPSAADAAGIGANMAFRRRLLIDLEGFDVRLDAGTCTHAGGDLEMLARVLDAGAQIRYLPGAQVWHRHRRTSPEMTACAFGYGAGTFAMLTKRVVEMGDAGALVTAARWVAGTAVKAVREKVARRPSPRWRVIVAEWLGAACGPFCFAYEAWRNRRQSSGLTADTYPAAPARRDVA